MLVVSGLNGSPDTSSETGKVWVLQLRKKANPIHPFQAQDKHNTSMGNHYNLPMTNEGKGKHFILYQ